VNMNTDIRIAVSFKGHRKRRKLRMLLGAGSTDYLIDLWINTATNHPDGILVGMDAMDVALEAGWEDDPGKFVSAMIESGFLDQDEEGTYRLHDWEDHQPFVIEAPKRSQQAKKAAEARWGKKPAKQSESKPNALRMPEACGEHADRNAPTYLPTKEEIKKPPYPPEGGEAGATLPPSPEDDPDVQPNANVSSLNECLIEFQDLVAVFQEAGGCVDVAPAYNAFLNMRHGFPLTRIVDDLAERSQSDAWKRMDVPMNLSTYLSKKKWLDPIPKPRERTRASPANPPPRTYQDQKQAERAEKAKRLKQELMGGGNGTSHSRADQERHGLAQHAPLAIAAKDG